MLFSLICIDRTDAGSLRADTRAKHLEYLKGAGDIIIFAGPMMNEAGNAVVGSDFLLNMESLLEVEAFAKKDPYNVAGLFSSVDARPTMKAIWYPDSMPD